MGSKTDKIKGRIKEAVGALTDNDDLKREGKHKVISQNTPEARPGSRDADTPGPARTLHRTLDDERSPRHAHPACVDRLHALCGEDSIARAVTGGTSEEIAELR